MIQAWWKEFFDDTYALLLEQLHSPAELANIANAIIQVLDLQKNDHVLDQCCGFGSLSLTLAEKGLRVTGIDQCSAYIKRARMQAESRYLPCAFYACDACTFLSSELCSAVINWRTSFGYSEKDEINKQMMECAFSSLVPGKKFVLDTINPAFVFAHFEEKRKRTVSTSYGPMEVIRCSAIDKARGMFTSHWTYSFPDGTQKTTYGESRIYFPADLRRMLEACGFRDICLRANIMGAELSDDKPRCIVIASR